MQKTTVQSQQESKKKKERDLHCFENHATKKRTCAHLMSLAQDNGTFIKSRHQQHVICIQTSTQTSFEQLFHLDYFTLVRTANLPRLLYLAASWLRDGFLVTCWWWRIWFLGGEMVSWWRVGWWRNSLVAR